MSSSYLGILEKQGVTVEKFLAIVALTFASLASNAADTVCKITNSSARGIEKVTISGPMHERDFRLRLFDQDNRQIETGVCDFSGECFDRDERTLAYDIPSRLYVRVRERRGRDLKMTIYPYVRQGVVDVECRILR